MPDLRDFLGKIEWEGGIDAALDYGLTTDGYDLPNDVKLAWGELVRLYGKYEEERGSHLGLIRGLIQDNV